MKKTEDIIEQLADDLKPVAAFALERRLAFAVLPALGFSLVLMLAILGLRVDMSDAMTEPGFWVKSAYNAVLATVAFFAVMRLARPEGERGFLFVWLALIFVAMALIALVQLGFAVPGTYSTLIIGSSALHCPFFIVAFALPLFMANFAVLKRSAPADPTLAGFAAGIAAGAAGAWVYSWFCTENGMAFVLIWYSLGILVTGIAGAFAGSRLLRW
ncbi:NrsF family protein [Agrobacterium salinitolerans]|uniref:NrsF family protein n=1 Tax=Agrobacterium TaxID=357 RepID=UPI0022B84967|nr:MULTISPECIES: NrsF family protein [Agrobacterium]MCZ7889132.1 NrsF family protein [Agrobacterium salinitolerans]MDA5628132.1 NrsF family protein [Agrobacterium sp. ST15.16.055]MDA6978122.1 NrsF family protein [Agrobacterium salinitolerans]